MQSNSNQETVSVSGILVLLLGGKKLSAAAEMKQGLNLAETDGIHDY
jgi:hypothetical protein